MRVWLSFFILIFFCFSFFLAPISFFSRGAVGCLAKQIVVVRHSDLGVAMDRDIASRIKSRQHPIAVRRTIAAPVCLKALVSLPLAKKCDASPMKPKEGERKKKQNQKQKQKQTQHASLCQEYLFCKKRLISLEVSQMNYHVGQARLKT